MILETYSKFIGGGSYMHESYNASLINENENIMNNFYQLLYENNNSWFEIKTLLDISDEIVHENDIVINESFSIKEIAKKIIEKIKNFFRKLKELFLSAINAIKKKFKSQEVKKDCQEIRKAVETQRNSGNAQSKTYGNTTKRLALPGVLEGKIRVNTEFLKIVQNNGNSFVMWLYENMTKLIDLDAIFNKTYEYCKYLKKDNLSFEDWTDSLKRYLHNENQKIAEGYNKVLKLICEKFKGLDKYVGDFDKQATNTSNNDFFEALHKYTADQLENDKYKEDIDVLDVLDMIENVDKFLIPLDQDVRSLYKIKEKYQGIVFDFIDNIEDIFDSESLLKYSKPAYNAFNSWVTIQFNLITIFSKNIITSYDKMMMRLYIEAKKYKIR